MLSHVRKHSSTIPLLLVVSAFGQAQSNDSMRNWKGYSILGNGHLTAVYSDDSRVTALTHSEGIQHFYFKDYTADYIASTTFRLKDKQGVPIKTTGQPSVGIKTSSPLKLMCY